LFCGAQLSRTIGDIETKNFDLSKNDNYPLEYYYPVSTKKNSEPDLETRRVARNFVWGILGGISFKF